MEPSFNVNANMLRNETNNAIVYYHLNKLLASQFEKPPQEIAEASRSASAAKRRAVSMDTTPTCSPLGPTRRTSGTRIRSFVRGSLIAGSFRSYVACSTSWACASKDLDRTRNPTPFSLSKDDGVPTTR